MGQRGNRPATSFVAAILSLALLTVALSTGCRESKPGKIDAKKPTVASLSPAATDILLAIGAVDHVVAASNYDSNKPQVQNLPGVGDYLNVDWEQLSALKPDVLIVQVRESAAPEGFRQNAVKFGIKPVYIHIDNLADIDVAAKTVGDAVGETTKAEAAIKAMRDKLHSVAESVKGKPRSSTLVVTDEVGAGVAGSGTFLDEILAIAGGVNAAAGEGVGYPKLDREKTIALAPEVILHLLPDRPAPAVDIAKRYWQSMPEVPAVRNDRVYFLTNSSVMQPGLGVGDVAAAFADRLHPDRGKP